MRKMKGFTLIELMVVVMIVAILAAVLVPMMHGRINRARWSEGIAGAGTIATALRAYCVEGGVDIAAGAPSLDTLGLTEGDMAGKYFVQGDYAVTAVNFNATTGVLTYTITVTAPDPPTGGPVVLNAAGTFTGIP